MPLGIIGVCLSLSSTSTMAFMRTESKDTIETKTKFADKQVSMSLPTYEDIKLFVDNDIKIRWQ